MGEMISTDSQFSMDKNLIFYVIEQMVEALWF